MSREYVLERIRAALHETAGQERSQATPAPGVPVLPPAQVFDDPVALFVERARQLGVGVDVVPSMDEAAGRAAAWCAQQGIRRASAWWIPELIPLLSRLRAGGVEVLGEDAPLEGHASAEVGITGADWGIAETATLVLGSAPAQPRLASLLPPVHLAILRAGRIIPDLPALFARSETLPSALTFITGPSRSADVGLKPVLGAHGPTEVAVLLIR